MWNLSIDGCRIDGSPYLLIGSVVELLLVIPNPKGAVLVKEARVCWTRGREFGLRLVTVQPGEVIRLEQFITSHLLRGESCMPGIAALTTP